MNLQDVINKNVEWWISQILPQKANFKSGNDTVDIPSNILQNKLRSNVDIGLLKSFADKLKEKLEDEFINGIENIRLSVDYEPQGLLLEVAQEVGLSCYIFPCKTSTSLDFINLRLKAKLGYNQPFVDIFN